MNTLRRRLFHCEFCEIFFSAKNFPKINLQFFCCRNVWNFFNPNSHDDPWKIHYLSKMRMMNDLSRVIFMKLNFFLAIHDFSIILKNDGIERKGETLRMCIGSFFGLLSIFLHLLHVCGFQIEENEFFNNFYVCVGTKNRSKILNSRFICVKI